MAIDDDYVLLLEDIKSNLSHMDVSDKEEVIRVVDDILRNIEFELDILESVAAEGAVVAASDPLVEPDDEEEED